MNEDTEITIYYEVDCMDCPWKRSGYEPSVLDEGHRHVLGLNHTVSLSAEIIPGGRK